MEQLNAFVDRWALPNTGPRDVVDLPEASIVRR